MSDVAITKQENITSHQEGVARRTQMSITWEEIVNGGTYADNDTCSFTIAVKAGTMVKDVAVKLVTAFDDSGGGDELNVEVGDGNDDNGYITSAALHTDQSEITYVANTGALSDNENGIVYTAADTIDILFTPNVSTGTDYKLSELTAGEILVSVWSLDLN